MGKVSDRRLVEGRDGRRPGRRERGPGLDATGLFSGSLVGTAVMTALMEAAQAGRLTRISLPFMLGTMVTERRAAVRVWGSGLHMLNGVLFGSGYALVFERYGRAGWRRGAALGALHGMVVLVALLPILQEIHPRMAGEDEGPDPTPMLEPPGFLGLHYGIQTPAVALAGHVVYGAIVGSLYRPGGSSPR